jgi:hypothetical protein
LALCGGRAVGSWVAAPDSEGHGQDFEDNLSFDQGRSIGPILILRGRNARMTSAQLKATPKTLLNGDQVLVPNEEANETLLAELRY